MRLLAVVVVLAGAELQPALASKPVARTIVGCVAKGVFTSETGYVIRMRQPSGAPFELAPWANKRIRVSGHLLPGDVLNVAGAPTVLGPC